MPRRHAFATAATAAAAATSVLLLLTACLADAATNDVNIFGSGSQTPAALRTWQTVARVSGPVARVVVDATFSGSGLTREVDVNVEIPSGASPFHLAFGEIYPYAASERVNYDLSLDLTPVTLQATHAGKYKSVRTARFASKAVASRAFVDTVDQGVSAALAESTGSGGFTVRLFPVDAGRTYRVVLGYDVLMTQNTTHASFPIGGRAGAGTVRVAAVSPDDKFVLDRGSASAASASATPIPVESVTWSPDGSPDVRVAVPSATPTPVAGDLGVSRAAVGVREGAFHAVVSVQLPQWEASPSHNTNASSTTSAVFVVECSWVTRSDGIAAAQSALLGAILAADAAGIRRFNVLCFDVGGQWMSPAAGGWVPNTAEGRTNATLRFLDRVQREGAADLRTALTEAFDPTPALFNTTTDYDYDYDVFVIATGQATWGTSDNNEIAGAYHHAKTAGSRLFTGRVHTYQLEVAGRTNPTLLARLAQESRGAYVRGIPAATTRADQLGTAITRAHRAPERRVASILVNDNTEEDFVLGAGVEIVRPGEQLPLVWRSTRLIAGLKRVSIAVVLEDVVSKDRVTYAGKFDIPLIANGTAAAVRAFGVQATEMLESALPASELEARAVALGYGVVGATASLVMLETERDYQRFNIPEAQPFLPAVAVQPIAATRSARAAAIAAAVDPKARLRAFIGRVRPVQGSDEPITLADSVWDMVNASHDASDVDAFDRSQLVFGRVDRIASRNRVAEPVPKESYDDWAAEAAARHGAGDAAAALRGLTSLVAQRPGDISLRRDIAATAMEYGFNADAFAAFREAAQLRSFEPQSLLRMAQAASAMGRASLASVVFEATLAADWKLEYRDFKSISAMMYARHLGQIRSTSTFAADREPVVRRDFGVAERAALVAALTWSQDGADLDLHVTEPSGEECFFARRKTASGGTLSADVSAGYGPEFYVQPNDVRGKYRVDVSVYNAPRNRLGAPVRALVDVIEDWGYESERYELKTVVVKHEGQRVTMANVHREEMHRVPVVVARPAAVPSTTVAADLAAANIPAPPTPAPTPSPTPAPPTPPPAAPTPPTSSDSSYTSPAAGPGCTPAILAGLLLTLLLLVQLAS